MFFGYNILGVGMSPGFSEPGYNRCGISFGYGGTGAIGTGTVSHMIYTNKGEETSGRSRIEIIPSSDYNNEFRIRYFHENRIANTVFTTSLPTKKW